VELRDSSFLLETCEAASRSQSCIKLAADLQLWSASVFHCFRAFNDKTESVYAHCPLALSLRPDKALKSISTVMLRTLDKRDQETFIAFMFNMKLLSGRESL
jgi:hypothetical protein